MVSQTDCLRQLWRQVWLHDFLPTFCPHSLRFDPYLHVARCGQKWRIYAEVEAATSR